MNLSRVIPCGVQTWLITHLLLVLECGVYNLLDTVGSYLHIDNGSRSFYFLCFYKLELENDPSLPYIGSGSHYSWWGSYQLMMRIKKHHQRLNCMFQLGQLQGPRGSKKHLMIIDSELLKYKFGPHEDQIRAKLCRPLQRAYGVGLSIIICFWKAQDEPYRCYEDSVIRNRSQQAQNQPSILLRADLSWTRAGRQAELRGPLQKAYGVGSSIIICFRKAQDEPYRCYEDSVLRNISQQARIWTSSLLREDLSWGVRISA